jgi:glycosyltransferase involved in cell wall biosynthesis
MNLCIIVPCFNEAKRIPLNEFESFLSKFSKITIHFVNDGSTDITDEILDSFQKKYPEQVKILRLTKNLGKGNAIFRGMLKALENNEYDTLAFLDADLSTCPEECFYLAEKIRPPIQFVFGSRIKKIDNSIERKLFRFLIGRIIATAISKVLKIAVYDTQCGCKIFNRKTAKLAFGKPFISAWLFDVEIFFRLKNYFGTSDFIAMSSEIPLKKWKDQGNSKIKWSYGFKIWVDLFNIKRTYK